MAGDLTQEHPLVAITGSQRPYVFDLPQLLSLPSGFEFRFRYFPVWVADELKRELRRSKADRRTRDQSLAGEALVLIFHSQELKRLLPLRLCTVISIENLGPMLFLRFRLGPLAHVAREVIDADRNGPIRASEADRLGADAVSWLGLHHYDLGGALPKGTYLRRACEAGASGYWTPDSDVDTEAEATAWAALAALLQGEPQLHRVPLFKLIGFQRKNGGYRRPADMKRSFTVSSQRTKGYRLVEGERYRLRLLEWCETIRGQDDPGAAVTATMPKDLLSLEGSSNVVVGKYDVLEFSCIAVKPGYGEVAIRVEAPAKRLLPQDGGLAGAAPKTSEGTEAPGANALAQPIRPSEPVSHSPAEPPEWPYVFAARLPIHVRHNRRRLISLVLVGALGIVLYVWNPSIPLLIFKFKLPNPMAQLLGLLMMFTVLGEYLHRFVKFTSDVKDFPFNPTGSGGRHAT